MEAAMRDARKRLDSILLLLAAALLPALGRAENYSDIWWNPSESGWGITIADHETQLFAVWYTYDPDGSPTWFVIPGGTHSADRRSFNGDLYRTTGPSYAIPFDPSKFSITKVGTASFDFAPAGGAPGTARFTWTMGPTTRTRTIERQPFGSDAPDWGTDRTDIWWNSAESGWGLTLAQHGNNVFGVWFTYADSGKPLFVILPGVTFTAPDTFNGALYTTTGPGYDRETFDPSRVHVTPVGNATLRFTGDTGTFTATVNGITQTKAIARQPFGNARPAPIGKRLLASRGVWATFDRRGWPNGYYSGDMIRMLERYDAELAASIGAANVKPTVGAEISSQLDRRKAMGVETLTLELRATDATYTGPPVPPSCNVPPALGLLYPQPTAAELANLPKFLDLARAHGMRVLLVLNSTHMEEPAPRPNAQAWLGAIIRAVKDHPALDTIVFGGDRHVIANPDGSTRCGVPAEAPLWLGSTSYAGAYVEWAIGYGLSQGVAPRKLSAEAIVGDYFVDAQPPAGAEAEGGHLWSPIDVLARIFDDLGVAPADRTYAISFYSRRKCANPSHFDIACDDEDPHAWAQETAQRVRGVVGGAARVVAAEWGAMEPIASDWPAERAFESLAQVMAANGFEGGSYWIWTEGDAQSEADAARVGVPVRHRGLVDVYNPVQREMQDAYGFHLASIANGSFESGGATAAAWTGEGAGTVSRFRLADEPGQPVIATRGSYALRIVPGGGANDLVTAASDSLEVSPSTGYTTTANLRFRWSGGGVGSRNPSRPHVFLAVRYFKRDGSVSSVRAQDELDLYEEDSTDGFGTFPMTYTTPSDARSARIVFGVARNGFSQPITLDVDNVR
jgi:hypothetical protein